MYMILRFASGRRVDAILLRAARERITVVIPDQEDTLEFSLVGNQWISECGSMVEIESVVADDPSAMSRIWSDEMRPLVASAVS